MEPRVPDLPEEIVMCSMVAYACGIRPMDDAVPVEIIPPEYLYHTRPLQALCRRVILDRGLDFSKVNSGAAAYIRATDENLDNMHFSTTLRYALGNEALPTVPDNQLSVPAFPVHPMDTRQKSVFPFAFDPIASALRYLTLQKEIMFDKHLAEPAYVDEAIHRYQKFLQLQAKHRDLVLDPPLDIKAVWLAHMIRPEKYFQTCTKLFGEKSSPLPSFILATANPKKPSLKFLGSKETEQLWKSAYPRDSFENIKRKLLTSIFGDSAAKNSKGVADTLAIDLQSCEVIKDRQWYNDFHRALGNNKLESMLPVLLSAYELFLYHHCKHPRSRMVPPVQVDLIWHTHMCHPQNYVPDMNSVKGSFDKMYHVPWPSNEEQEVNRKQAEKFFAEYQMSLADMVKDTDALDAAKVSRFLRLNPHRCSFALTSNDFMVQKFYSCESCNLKGETGCCEACASDCHKGHDVKFVKNAKAYCDCGPSNSCKINK